MSNVTHIGRSFEGNLLEQECPCPLEPCGLVAQDKIDSTCDQHPFERSKTIRQAHFAEACPGVQELVLKINPSRPGELNRSYFEDAAEIPFYPPYDR